MKCEKCGKEVSDSALFCKYCGAPVPKEKNNTKKIIMIAGILCGVLLLGCVIVFAVRWLGKSESGNSKEKEIKKATSATFEEAKQPKKEERKKQEKKKGIDFIKAYEEYFAENRAYFAETQHAEIPLIYAIVDVQGDGIPEVILRDPSTAFLGETKFLYVGKNEKVKTFRDFQWISYLQESGLIYSTCGRSHSMLNESIFQYDASTDSFREIHSGSGYLMSEGYEDEELLWDGVNYPTIEAYDAKLNEVFSVDRATVPEYEEYTPEVDLLQEIRKFVEKQKKPVRKVDWKNAYKKYINSRDDVHELVGYTMCDINDDGVPELFMRSPIMYGEYMYYIDGKGKVQAVNGGGVVGYIKDTGMVWLATGHGTIIETFCQYNEKSGFFETVHKGIYVIAENDTYTVDGNSCNDYEEYKRRIDEFFDIDDYEEIRFHEFHGYSKLEELLNFVEHYK